MLVELEQRMIIYFATYKRKTTFQNCVKSVLNLSSNRCPKRMNKEKELFQKRNLTLSTLDKTFSRRHFEIFSYFSKKTGLDISCKLSPPMETICMKWQSLFSGKKIRTYHQFVVCWISPESGKCLNSPIWWNQDSLSSVLSFFLTEPFHNLGVWLKQSCICLV